MLLIAFGTRPEWLKLKPIIEKLDKEQYVLLYTGQHFELLEDLKVFTNYNTDIIDQFIECGTNRLDSIVYSILKENSIDNDNILKNINHVMIQGDTTSAFAIALSAFHHQIPIIHVEAGIRTYTNEPYPEEFNRRAISLMANIHFCPTETEYNNLEFENIITKNNNKVFTTGNTSIDNLVKYGEPKTSDNILITLHRRENHPDLAQWFQELEKLADAYPQYNFVIPLHLNPNVQKHKNIFNKVKILHPLNHKECIEYIRTACMIITDSGGIQEEASWFRKRCIVCRRYTDRPQSIKIGTTLCRNPQELIGTFKAWLKLSPITDFKCPFGDGQASERIIKHLKELNVIK